MSSKAIDEAVIPGGYYIKARKIQESEIAQAPPHVREIWDWLLREASYKDQKIYGKTIRRGQCIRSIEDIRVGLSWKVGYRKERYSTTACENAMKFLRKRGMIATTKTGRGTVITICNYNLYQNPKNYECRNECRNECRSAAEPNTRKKRSKKKINTFPSDSVEVGLAEFFIKLLEDRGYEGKLPYDPQKWAGDLDLLIRIDGRDPEQIKKVIEWSQSNDFWKRNILSPGKLRKQWGPLTEKMKAEKGNKTSKEGKIEHIVTCPSCGIKFNLRKSIVCPNPNCMRAYREHLIKTANQKE